jgi:hypothetical protein
MVAGDSDTSSTATDKLEALLAHRRAWLNLNWTTQTVFAIDPASRAYDLVDGVFAQQNGALDSFAAIWLPSSPDSAPKTTYHSDLGMQGRDFVIDPTQDLVAFVHEHATDAAQIECRTLSSLKPHPSAATPILSFPLHDGPMGQELAAELADDVIGLFFGPMRRLVLLNWREGTILAVWNSSPFRRDCSDPNQDLNMAEGTCGFSMLSPRAFLLGHLRASGEIGVWSFEGSGRNPPTHNFTLELPETIEEEIIESIITHSGPFRAQPAAGKPFSKVNESRLCVIDLEYNAAVFTDIFSVFVPHRYLPRLLLETDGGRVIPWETWGPQHSRMFLGMEHVWLRCVAALDRCSTDIRTDTSTVNASFFPPTQKPQILYNSLISVRARRLARLWRSSHRAGLQNSTPSQRRCMDRSRIQSTPSCLVASPHVLRANTTGCI